MSRTNMCCKMLLKHSSFLNLEMVTHQHPIMSLSSTPMVAQPNDIEILKQSGLVYFIEDFRASMFLQYQYQISQNSVCNDDRKHDSDPFSNLTIRPRVLICLKDSSAANLTLRLEVGRVHTLKFSRHRRLRAVPDCGTKLVDQHALKDVGLIVNVVEDI